MTRYASPADIEGLRSVQNGVKFSSSNFERALSLQARPLWTYHAKKWKKKNLKKKSRLLDLFRLFWRSLKQLVKYVISTSHSRESHVEDVFRAFKILPSLRFVCFGELVNRVVSCRTSVKQILKQIFLFVIFVLFWFKPVKCTGWKFLCLFVPASSSASKICLKICIAMLIACEEVIFALENS